jgi:uncharacterized membrane-anchored protein YitT (DUF2179 family)
VERRLALGSALAIIALLTFFLLASIVSNGVTGLAVVTAGILAIIGFGVLGALMNPPHE